MQLLTLGKFQNNCRSETAAEKASFKTAWKYGKRCIVPAESIYEPCWETGKAVRWRIRREDGVPMGIAGLWSSWKAPDGGEHESFCMLTVNADGHPLMQRFHRPEDEKRMVVVLDDTQYDEWLDAPPDRMMSFMQRWPADRLFAEPAPLVRRSAKGTAAPNAEDPDSKLGGEPAPLQAPLL